MGVDKDSAAVSAPAVAITLATPQLRKSQNHRSKEDDKVTDTTSHHRGLYRWAWCRRFASIGWATSLVIAFIFVVSIVWTAFLVVINVAPNGSANAVMTTGTLDGGNFWQFSAPTDSIVSISSILLLAIVLIYSYLLLLLLFGPPAPRAPRQGRARPRQPNAQANRLRRNAATMSRLAVPLATLRRKSRPVTQFYHELVVPDGKYRKLYNVALEIPEVVLQILSLRSYMLKGLDPPLLYLYACLMATNAYIVFYTIQFGWREDAFHQIVHDAMFDATFAVFFPALVLLYCVGNFQGDLESVKILQQYFPPHAYERTGRIYVEPAQVNTFSAGYESLIMTAVSDIFLKIAFNLLSCMRWRKILLLLMEDAKQKQFAQHPRRPRVYDQFHQHVESAQADTVTPVAGIPSPESTSVVEPRDQADQEPPNARAGQHRLTNQRPTTNEHPTMDQLLATDLARLPEPATSDTAKRTDEAPPATSHRPPNSTAAPKRVVPVYVGIIFFLVGTACITYPAVVIQRAQAACADYSGCILVSYAWETTGKVCNCLAYVDRDLAPNASEVLPDVTDTLEILARAGKLETIQLINRKINQTLPDSVQLCTGLRNMVLIYTGIEEIPAWANETMTKLEYLHIEGSSDDDTNLASLPDNFFNQMSRLLSLHLAYHPSLTTLPPLEGLESLEILYLGQLDSLKEMPDFGDLPYLQAAAFEELPEVQTLPDLSTYADTLTTLVIQDMGVCCSGYLASGVCNTSFPTCCEEETSTSGSSSSTGSAGVAPSSPTSSTVPSPTSTATAASHSSSGSSSSSSHASQLSPSGSSGSSSAASHTSQSPASGSSMSSQPSQPGQSTQPSQSPSSSSSSSSSTSSPSSSSSSTAHSSFNGGGSGSGDAGSDGSMGTPVGQTSDGSRPLPPECLSQPVNDSSLPNNATLTLLQGFMADTTNFCDASVAVCRKKSGSEGTSAKAADVCAGVLYRQCSTGICYNPGMGRVQCVSLQSVIDMRKAEIAKGASCNKQEEQWLGCK